MSVRMQNTRTTVPSGYVFPSLTPSRSSSVSEAILIHWYANQCNKSIGRENNIFTPMLGFLSVATTASSTFGAAHDGTIYREKRCGARNK